MKPTAQPTLEHSCARCGGYQMQIDEVQRDIRAALRVIETRPGTPSARASRDRIPILKQTLRESKIAWEMHRFEASA